MSYPAAGHQHGGTQLGSHAFNHNQSQDAEHEYDRLRNLARQEAGKRASCFDKSHQAYERGDGAAAHELSEEGKRHGAMMEQYNKQASDFIFRENNAPDRVVSDTIDLHGQFVEEAEDILEARIKYAQRQNQAHLHVIVGKGNHSVNHIQKLKPRVEEVCRELGLQYATEENAGRILINLQGGQAIMPPLDHSYRPQQSGGHGANQNYGGQQQHTGQQHGNQPQQHHQQQQEHGGQQNQNQELEAAVKKYLPRILRKLEKQCCVVM